MMCDPDVQLRLVIYRLPLLRARNELDSWVSREAAFLANNWILLFSAFFVLFATMFPTLSEAVTGERLTVGPPFFNKWMLPIGLILLHADRHRPAARVAEVDGHRISSSSSSGRSSPRSSRLAPVCASACACGAPGSASRSARSCSATIMQEFVRGAQVRRTATGTDIFTALVGLVGRSKRRYGGYIVHLGIVLMFLGFAGEGFKQEEQALLKPGRADDRRALHRPARRAARDHRQPEADGDRARQRVRGRQADRHDEPAKWYFHKREQEPTTEVAIRRAPSEDLYIVLAGYDAARRAATYAVTVNPLVNWIWFGFASHGDRHRAHAAAGERVFAFAVVEGAGGRGDDKTSAAAVDRCCLVSPRRSSARTEPSVVPKSSLERELEAEVMCTCGCRAADEHLRDGAGVPWAADAD